MSTSQYKQYNLTPTLEAMYSFHCPKIFLTICFYFVTSSQGAEFSNVALLLKNIARVEDMDINMIGRFQQALAETVNNKLCYHLF